MVRIWNPLIRPLVDQVAADCVLEVGAEKGRSTRVLLSYLKRRGGTLHCIDPCPDFDYEELVKEGKGRLHFHKKLSLEIIPRLPRFEIGLLDGDHNWYTVFNELKQIEILHGGDPAAFPLLFLHDVGWPYGRRDLYYDPATIPDEYRQPYARMGILPDKSELHPERGLNTDLYNATQSGGGRNGVLTGIEDYIEQSMLTFRLIVLPIYYGLAILVTEAKLCANSGLSEALDELVTATGWAQVCEIGERLRCVENLFLQAADRELRVLRQRLSNLESEANVSASEHTGKTVR